MKSDTMEEAEGQDQPWESLDIDDSDLSSFLRPCKRQNQSHLPPEVETIVSSSPSHSEPIFELNHQAITNSNTKSAVSSSSVLIPGPAGAVQAAMQRREIGVLDGLMLDDEVVPVPTQEFIRRVAENGGHNDYDFTSNPWLCALDFLRRKGMVGIDGKEIYVPLGSIRGSRDQRLEQVVAVVKSYKPNGLGDVMVTLKDPTGTVDASIHGKVFLDGEFGKGISVGAVLILQKVVVFCPNRSASYLNVTSRNIVKIISKDCGPPSKHSYPAMEVSRIAPNTESCRKSKMPKQTKSPLPVRTEVILSSISSRQNGPTKENDQNERDRDNDDEPETSFNGNLHIAVAEPSQVKRSTRQEYPTPLSGIAIHDETNTYQLHNPSVSSNISGASAQVNVSDQDTGRKDGLANKIKMASKASLPEWTEEQLDELLAFD